MKNNDVCSFSDPTTHSKPIVPLETLETTAQVMKPQK